MKGGKMMSTRRKTQAVVLAGGFGTRLSPLTDTKPKPLVKILDKTVLESVVSAVKKTEADKIIVSTCYKADMIAALCKEWDGNIVCKKENTPLGTAGGVRNCCDGKYDAVLVVSGDAVFDFSLQRAIDYHFEHKSDVTIITSRNENPTRFGVVISDDEDNVIRFDEKPSWKRVVTDLVNTGIYVLSPYAIESIPERMEYDFSKNLFPKLMREGRVVKSMCENSFWCDIGTLDEYHNCNVLAAANEIMTVKNDGLNQRQLVRCGIHADENVYVSHSACVGKNVKLGKGSILCEKTVVSDDCDIAAAIVGKGTVIGKGSIVNSAILGENVSVGENCIVPEGVVIGDGCRIADGTVLKRNRCVKSGTSVSEGDKAKMEFERNADIFVDDGVAFFEEDNLYSHLAAFCSAVSLSYRKSDDRHISVCVMCEKTSTDLKNVLISGFVFHNDMIFDCGMGNETLLAYGVKKLEADVGLLAERKNGSVYVSVLSQNGMPLDIADERKIAKIYSSFEDNKPEKDDCEQCADIIHVPVSKMYEISLLKYAEKLLGNVDLSGVEISVSQKECEENPVFAALCKTLRSKSCKMSGVSNKELVNVSLSEDGKRITVRKGTLVLDNEHVNAAVFKNAHVFQNGGISARDNVPFSLRGMIKDSNVNSDELLCITTDGAANALAFLTVLKMTGESYETLAEDIPNFEIYTDEYVADVNRGATMERLSKLYSDTKREDGDGICLHLAEGNVTVIPNRAKGFKLIAEAHSMEVAKEIAFKVGKAIKNEQ